jgi:hypothetical protein
MPLRRPTPFSLALTRALSIPVTLATAAIGRELLLAGARLKGANAHVVGPAGPDFSSFFNSLFVTLEAYLVCAVVIPLLWGTIGVWRRSHSGALLLAVVCLLCAAPAIRSVLESSRDARTPAVIPPWALIAYAALAIACAVAAINAAADIRPVPAHDEQAFPVGPPPLPTARPDFHVIDDLPKDED